MIQQSLTDSLGNHTRNEDPEFSGVYSQEDEYKKVALAMSLRLLTNKALYLNISVYILDWVSLGNVLFFLDLE